MDARLVDSKTDWDAFAAGCAQTSALQCYDWGEFKARWGWRPFRVWLTDGGQPAAGAQVLRKPLGPGVGMLYLGRGPILSDNRYWPDLLKAIKELVVRPGDLFLKVEPEAEKEGYPDLGQWGLVPGTPIQPRCTFYQDLTMEDEALLASFKSKTRYNVRLAQNKHGVTVDQCQFEEFWPLFIETQHRGKLLAHPKQYYADVVTMLGDHAGMFLAKYRDQPLAAALIVHFAGKAYYFYGGSTDEHREVMAPYALHWEIMRWARSVGCHTYDWWGIPCVITEEHHSYGVWRFKQGFSPRHVFFAPPYDWPLSALYGLGRAGEKLFRMAKNYVARRTTRDLHE